MVGRVPPGKSACDALYEAKMTEVAEHLGLSSQAVEYWKIENRKWVNRLGEEQCRGFYARVYASGEDQLTLTVEEFMDFKRAGGRAAR